MRILVGIGLAVLAIDLLLVGWMVVRVVGDSRERRWRNRFEHLGVVPLPSMLAPRRSPARKAWVGAAVAAAVVLGVSRVSPAPAALTDASPPIGPSAVAPGYPPGGDHIAATDAGAEPNPTPVPSASAAFQSVSPSPSVASADAAGTGASSTVAAVSTSATTIQLLWAPVQDASRYDVERSTVLPSWAPVGTTGAAETSFVDDSVSAGTTYYYRVVAFVAGQEPLQSDAVSATTPADLSTPPQFIVVTASATSVDLLWRDVEGELGYRIERSLDGTTGWIGIGTTGQDVTSFTDADLTPATTYSYRVIAVGTDAESPPSAVFTLATDADAPSESTKRDTSSAARRPTSTSASSTTAR